MYSEVCGPNYKMQEGLAPDVVGGEFVWPQFRFFPFSGGPWGPVGVEAPGSRPVHGSLTAPARIRDGTQGIANLKGGSLLTAALGGSFGAGPRQVSFSCERQHGLICRRTEPL